MNNSMPPIDRMKQQAGDAMKAGRTEQAEHTWLAVIEQAPRDEDALFALGFHAQIKGQTPLAVQRFRAAVEHSSANPLLRMTLAKALKTNGDIEGHFIALTAALDVDPYFVPAHLMRAEGLVELGRTGAAQQVYRDVFKIVGPRDNWPVPLRGQLAQAQRWLEGQSQIVRQTYLDALTSLKANDDQTDWARLDEAAGIVSGTTKAYHQEPVMLHIPRLPAIPFYNTADFPWVAALEAQSQVIIDELTQSLAQAESLAVPYVAYDAGIPVNQWAELNHSKRWSAVFFYKNGQEMPAAHAQFPATSAILKSLPLAQINGFCPNVIFSTLAPKSVIPPHTGETNARLVGHLPLIVPDKCRYRVGNEWRTWEVGKALIFDDSIEHEAINDSDLPRVVLIFDIWNPYLTPQECDGVRALLATRNALLES
jgi:aspartate beta-hydroxylase